MCYETGNMKILNVWPSEARKPEDFKIFTFPVSLTHNFLFLSSRDIVERFVGLLNKLFHFGLEAKLLVLAHAALLFFLLNVLPDFVAHFAQRHPSLFKFFFNDFDECSPAFACKFGKRNSDAFVVNTDRNPEVCRHDRFLNRFYLATIPNR